MYGIKNIKRGKMVKNGLTGEIMKYDKETAVKKASEMTKESYSDTMYGKTYYQYIAVEIV